MLYRRCEKITNHTELLIGSQTQTHAEKHVYTYVHTDTHTPKKNTKKFLHTEIFTLGSFYTQNLLHTEPFTHRRFYTQKLLHRPVSTQTLLHTTLLHTTLFTHKHFCTQTLHRIAKNHQFFTLEPHFVWKGCCGHFKIANSQQFLTLEPHFVRKGCRRTNQSRKKPSAFDDRTSFRAKWLPRKRKFAILLQFLTIEPHCASSALPKREKKKKERDRDRGQEGKREREKMWRCEDVTMWRREQVREDVWRCADVRMWKCEDLRMICVDVKMKMWRCEDIEDDLCRCEDEDVKMYNRPPLLEEPFGQTLSGKIIHEIENTYMVPVKTWNLHVIKGVCHIQEIRHISENVHSPASMLEALPSQGAYLPICLKLAQSADHF